MISLHFLLLTFSCDQIDEVQQCFKNTCIRELLIQLIFSGANSLNWFKGDIIEPAEVYTVKKIGRKTINFDGLLSLSLTAHA